MLGILRTLRLPPYGVPLRRPTSLPAALVALSLLAAACGGGGGDDARATSTTVTSAPPSSEPAPTTEAPPGSATTAPGTTGAPGTTATTARATTAPTAAPEPLSCPAVPARAAPRPDRSRYTLTVDVRPAENVVTGVTSVRFMPDLETDRLVFRLWPNAPRTARAGARLDVESVTVGGQGVPTGQPDATTLRVDLPATVGPGQAVDASVGWRLTLPGSANDRISRTGDAIRLGSFFPLLAWEPGLGWALEPPSSGFAEASMAPTADFTATVTVPEGFRVLATGVDEGGGRWTANAVPDFALSVGRFAIGSRTVGAPDPVQVTVGVHEGIGETPGPYLDKVTRVLEDFARRFGPYPWPSYSLAVTPNLSGGIEYPMHVMQGPGKIGRTTSHEVGHMWFYGMVASNQGRDPWMDEGLATWAEARWENSLGEVRATSVPAAGVGKAGEPMTYWESRQSIYYRSVYVQGAQALAALGPADLVDCALRHYVATQAFRVARPADLIASMKLVFPRAEEVMGVYGIRP